MRYFGGKQRISKPLAEYLNSQLEPNQPFVDLFCGSCNVISKIDPNRIRIANDKHPYLIAMWRALQDGWIPPDYISEDAYKRIRHDTSDPALHGFVGFGLSYSGKWWGGYCRDSRGDDYSGAAKRSTLAKSQLLSDVVFENKDYTSANIPDNSLIYCDIPYRDTTPYCKNLVGTFDHGSFYVWCKQMSNRGQRVFVSEYAKNVPTDATVVWSKNSNKEIRNKDGVREPTTEVLFTFS